MAVPRHHLAKGRQGRRRSHLALRAKKLAACSQCKKMIPSHTVCKYCGFYKGRQVLPVLARQLKKQEKRRKAGGK
ncbi:MAG: 50S ribosomal protein L32 [Patescibacteria group bacterium]